MSNTDGNIIYNLQTLSGLTTEEFRERILGEKSISSNTQVWSNIKYGDYLTKEMGRNAKNDINNKINWIKTRGSLFEYEQEKILISGLINILRIKDLRYAKSNPKGKSYNDNNKTVYTLYDKKSKKVLLNYLKNMRKQVKDIKKYEALECIWLVMYFAIYKQLPSTFNQQDKLLKDIEEYNTMVIHSYGIVTNPAHRAIVELANVGNVVAQNTLGELFCYGRLSKGIPQYEDAYHWFQKAAGSLEDENAIHYPLACWNVAYMLFNYHFRRNLKEGVNIRELNVLTHETRTEMAIRYCILALKNDPTCIPVYNLLGVMLDVLETMENRKEIYKRLSEDSYLTERMGVKTLEPEIFFQKASQAGYVEASNNLARRETKRALAEPDRSRKQKEYIQKAIYYLQQSAERNGTWACRKLGELYTEGKINVYYEEVGKLDTRYYNREDDEYIDLDKAYHYYLKAFEYFLDTDSAWSALHLLESFDDYLDAEQYKEYERVIEIVNNKEIRQKYNEYLENRVKEK